MLDEPIGGPGHEDHRRDHEHDWLDHEAGPLVRPYTMTGGRVRPATGGLDLLAFVVATYHADADLTHLQPEHHRILAMTQDPLSLAEIAGRLDLGVGVVRVLLGDLLHEGLVAIDENEAAGRPPDDDVLRAVIDGLRAL